MRVRVNLWEVKPLSCPTTSRRYAIVAPSRNEAATMRKTLDSVLAQTLKPEQLVFIDDGSTDETQAILAEYVPLMPFLTVINRHDAGERRVGAGVVEAVTAGLAQVDTSRVSYLCKLDMDLELPPSYFAELIARMEADPTIATCSGKPFFHEQGTGRLISEYIGDEFAAGMTKFYRLSAFESIGGFVPLTGWDGIDCHMSRMQGLKAISFPDPCLRFVHLRPMGSSHVSIWHGRMRHGRGAWNMGVPPLFMAIASLYRANKRPFVLGAVAMAWGYLQAWIEGSPRFDAPGYQHFVRSYYLSSLLLGRTRAAERARLRAARRHVQSQA
jgi:glycosyltransferase involved in cell wall biosynthesis